jgi:hypothetical protein
MADGRRDGQAHMAGQGFSPPIKLARASAAEVTTHTMASACGVLMNSLGIKKDIGAPLRSNCFWFV